MLFNWLFWMLWGRVVRAAPPELATCNEGSPGWLLNDQGRSPCNLSEALETVCFGPLADYPQKISGPNGTYSGAGDFFSNKCDCSSVMYCLISACSFCQGGIVTSWNNYVDDCKPDDIAIGSFPLGIPNGVSIPSWAFVDIRPANVWSATQAQDLAGKLPDLTSNPPAPLNSDGHSEAGTHSSKGIIIGGVIGGVIGLGLFIYGVVMLKKLLQSKNQPAKNFSDKSRTADTSSFSSSPTLKKFTNPNLLTVQYKGLPEV